MAELIKRRVPYYHIINIYWMPCSFSKKEKYKTYMIQDFIYISNMYNRLRWITCMLVSFIMTFFLSSLLKQTMLPSKNISSHPYKYAFFPNQIYFRICNCFDIEYQEKTLEWCRFNLIIKQPKLLVLLVFLN